MHTKWRVLIENKDDKILDVWLENGSCVTLHCVKLTSVELILGK